jgi:hypothetical protein
MEACKAYCENLTVSWVIAEKLQRGKYLGKTTPVPSPHW